MNKRAPQSILCHPNVRRKTTSDWSRKGAFSNQMCRSNPHTCDKTKADCR